MKKLFISMLTAAACLTACNEEQTIAVQSNAPMAFGASFVENATRAAADPSTVTATLNAFDVWAYMDQPDGLVLSNEDVTKSGSKWAYTNIQYWLPEHTYYFGALAPMNSANWSLNTEDIDIEEVGVVSFTNVDGSEDLLFASTSVNTNGMEVGADMDAVKFQFNHLLSKVKYTFKNGFRTDNVSLVIRDVKMTAPEKATIALANDNWSDENVWVLGEGTKTLEFGDVETLTMGQQAEAAQERLTIPASAAYEYDVTFKVDMYMGAVLAHTFEKASTITGAAFEMGKAYNLVAEINPENLNLTAIEFDVIEVKEWVNQTINGGAIGDKWEVVSTIEALQAALNAATGNTSISIGADLTGNVTVPELKGATVSINGNGHTFDGTFALVGGSTYGEGTTVFENINFATQGLNGYDAFIYCNEQNGNTRYPDNVIIKDCSFAGANDLPVGAKFRSLNGNLLMTNCTAENMHSLVQLTSCGKANVTIDGATVTNCKNGIGLGQTAYVAIKNSTINAREYGVRADGCATTTEITNSNIAAKQPIIVRKVTVDGYVLNVDDATVLTPSEAYDIIFTKGSDDAAYVAPTGSFTCNAPATAIVYPTSVKQVANADDLKSAIESGAPVIALTENNNYGTFTLGEVSNVTIYGANNASIIFNTDANTKIENVTLSQIDFVYDGSTTNFGVVINKDAQINNLVLDGCSMTGTGEKKGRGIYGQNPNATIVIKNCEFSNMGYPVYTMSAGGYKSLTVENCTFSLIKSWAIMPQYNDYLGDLTVTGCTFENCTGGLVKAGKFTAGHTFTFTDNTITNSTEHPAKDWFTINTENATAVVSGNVKDGAAWTPGSTEGLK